MVLSLKSESAKIRPVCLVGVGKRGWIRPISIPWPISLDFTQDRASY